LTSIHFSTYQDLASAGFSTMLQLITSNGAGLLGRLDRGPGKLTTPEAGSERNNVASGLIAPDRPFRDLRPSGYPALRGGPTTRSELDANIVL